MMDRLLQVANFKGYMLVALGGGLGCVLRWFLSKNGFFGQGGVPKSTLVANLIAALILGLSAGLLERFQEEGGAAPLYLFTSVGFAGGLSTFSTFAFEILNLITAGSVGTALLSLVLNVVLSVLLVLAGRFLIHSGFPGA